MIFTFQSYQMQPNYLRHWSLRVVYQCFFIKMKTRLRGDLNYTNKTLKETRQETPKLLQNKNKKCTKSGLELYGIEGCANAKNSLEKNYQRIEELKSKIKTYQSDIGKYR